MSTGPVLDERENLPSASSALYDSLCPGRWRAQKDYESANGPVAEDVEQGGPEYDLDRDAEAGKRIHLLYAGKPCPAATDAERDRAAAGREIDQLMYGKWIELIGQDESPVIEIRERRFWVYDTDGKTKLYSGQADALWIKGKEGGPCHILLSDLKGLWGHHDDAALNMQIRRYLAIVTYSIQKLGYTEVLSAMAYLNQPAKTMNPRPVVFNQEDLLGAVIEMVSAIADILDPDAPRHAGPVQCHRCKAKLVCGEFINDAYKVTQVSADGIPTKEQMQVKVMMLTGEKLGSIIPWAKALEEFVHLAETEARSRLKSDPDSVPGWMIKPNPDRHPINDVGKIYERLVSQLAITPAEFTGLCELSKSAVEKLLRAKAGLKGKKLDEAMKALCEGATGTQKIAPSLVQKG